jgi:biotin carboxyl carrier protein
METKEEQEMLRKFRVKVNGKEYIVEVEELSSEATKVQTSAPSPAPSKVVSQPLRKEETKPKPQKETKPQPAQSEGHSIIAPMSGVILEILVSPGTHVKAGDTVVVMEAMKMENNILSEFDGVVKEVKVNKGDNVEAGQVMVVLE